MKEQKQFIGPRAKLRAVRRKSAEFGEHLAKYVEASRADPESIRSILKPPAMEYVVVANLPPVPDDMSVIVGEAIVQLRSCLDQLACELALISGAKSDKGVYFPIAKTEKDYQQKGTRDKVKALRPDLVDIVDSYRPFGDSLLVALNDLANMDKHRRLIEAMPDIEESGFQMFGKKEFQRLEFQFRHPKPGEYRNAELLRVPVNTPMDGVHMSLNCNVVFAVEPVTGRKVADTARDMLELVESIVGRFEEHCAKKP